MTDVRRLRVHSLNPSSFFEAGFRHAAETRMKGLPVLNPKVAVRAHGFRRWGNDWIGAMTTPWAIFCVFACGCRETWPETRRAGSTFVVELPAGDFTFTTVEDEVLGAYGMLSLKSPVNDVGDGETADMIAQMALDMMLTADRIPEDDEDAVPLIPPNADGELRRVIPIRIAPPKNVDETPVLTPKAAEPAKDDEREPFFDRIERAGRTSVSRRKLFAPFAGGKKAEKAETENNPSAGASESTPGARSDD